MGRSLRDSEVLSELQVSLLAHLASGLTVWEAANEVHISPQWAYESIRYAKRKLGAPTIPACVMRAHRLGFLSHPTGYSEQVFAIDAGLTTPGLALAASS